MNEIGAMLDDLAHKANGDDKLKQKFLSTRDEPDSIAAFCRQCNELGYPIYEMDLIQAGEEFYASLRRSTNGGGENSPKLAGEDDLYEMFMAGLE